MPRGLKRRRTDPRTRRINKQIIASSHYFLCLLLQIPRLPQVKTQFQDLALRGSGGRAEGSAGMVRLIRKRSQTKSRKIGGKSWIGMCLHAGQKYHTMALRI